jgi:hypothetical protein
MPASAILTPARAISVQVLYQHRVLRGGAG